MLADKSYEQGFLKFTFTSDIPNLYGSQLLFYTKTKTARVRTFHLAATRGVVRAEYKKTTIYLQSKYEKTPVYITICLD